MLHNVFTNACTKNPMLPSPRFLLLSKGTNKWLLLDDSPWNEFRGSKLFLKEIPNISISLPLSCALLWSQTLDYWNLDKRGRGRGTNHRVSKCKINLLDGNTVNISLYFFPLSPKLDTDVPTTPNAATIGPNSRLNLSSFLTEIRFR